MVAGGPSDSNGKRRRSGGGSAVAKEEGLEVGRRPWQPEVYLWLPVEDRWQPGDAGRAEEEWSGWSGGGGGDVAVIRLLGAVKERW